MKALTVCQPFAWLLIFGKKRVENRSWPTNYRGPLAIHAGRSRAWLKVTDELPEDVPPAAELAFGAVLGIVDLVDCVRLADAPASPYASGPWCWLVAKPRALPEPFAWTGALSLFTIPDQHFPREFLPTPAEVPAPAPSRARRK